MTDYTGVTAYHTQRLWDGKQWVTRKTLWAARSLKIDSELPAFMEAHNIPPDAEIGAGIEYYADGPVLMFSWSVPAEEE